jgi:diguanylate cyclase (GGDEF)-like protein/PAS domain S-box-containing protein
MVASLGFDLFPDESKFTMQARQSVSETLAVQLASLIEQGDKTTLERTLKSVTARGNDIISVAVRRDDGTIVAEAGDHQKSWVRPSDGRSTLTHVIIPVHARDAHWGDIELVFRPLSSSKWNAWLKNPALMLGGLLIPGVLVYYLYLRRALQYLDPTAVIPERIRLAFDGLAEGLLVLDLKGRIVLANSAFRRLHKQAAENLTGRRASDLAWLKPALSRDTNEHPWVKAIWKKAPMTGQHMEIPQENKEAKKVIVNANPLLDGKRQVKGCLITFDDVSELHRLNAELLHAFGKIKDSRDQISLQNEKLEKLANQDSLTGCLNRRAFFTIAQIFFEQMRDASSNLCCLMIDIDRFKSVNDRFGHSVGDQVIMAVSNVLQSSLRKGDVLCRFGGEEFCILLADITPDLAAEVAEGMRERIEAQVSPNIDKLAGAKVTASFGVSSIATGNCELLALIEQADQALYQAKKNGRNRICRRDEAGVLWLTESALRSAGMSLATIYADTDSAPRDAQETLRANEECFRLVTESLSDLIVILDAQGRRLYNSPSYHALFPDNAVAVGSNSFEQIHPEDRGRVVEIFRETVETGVGKPAHFRFQAPDGSVRFIESQSTVLRDVQEQVDRVVVVSRDVTERVEAEQRIRYLAQHDLLTDLPNRTMVKERLEQAIDEMGRSDRLVGVLLIDLDQFKEINVSIGSTGGDALLRQVAGRLRGCVRDTDTVGRQGGDTFIVVLPGLGEPTEAGLVAEKLLNTLSQKFLIGANEIDITASIGISIYPRDGATPEILMDNADTALNLVKTHGNNNYGVYSCQTESATKQRLEVQKGLRGALSRDELVLHYQPCVDVGSTKLIGAEALIRWQHPTLGLLEPSSFIPYAEDNALICSIGEWVLFESCRQNKAWQDAGHPPIRMAVNVSGRQLQERDFVDRVSRILSETGMAPQWLEVEITESVLMRHVEQTITVLDDLRKLGVKMALDDFGTGYSSLGYLKRFAVDRLKIDRSFVRDIAEDTNDAAIVSTIIAIAKTLHLATTAEGVETEAQLARLRALGCEEAQGFYFAKPVCAAEFEEMYQIGEMREEQVYPLLAVG